MNNSYEEEFTFMTSNYTDQFDWAHGTFKSVAPEDSYNFFYKLFTWGIAQGMSNFEVDFMDFTFLLQERVR
jgi:hypothetical protein